MLRHDPLSDSPLLPADISRIVDLSLLLLKLFKDLTTRIGQEKSRQSSRLLSISNAKCTTQFDR